MRTTACNVSGVPPVLELALVFNYYSRIDAPRAGRRLGSIHLVSLLSRIWEGATDEINKRPLNTPLIVRITLLSRNLENEVLWHPYFVHSQIGNTTSVGSWGSLSRGNFSTPTRVSSRYSVPIDRLLKRRATGEKPVCFRAGSE